MDILHFIREKIKSIQQEVVPGLKAVVVHIETAERYWNRAREEKDDDLYTDVIYRTNHAFEGILKEAYAVLTEKDSSSKTPYEIESYLLSNNVLKQRVMDLFTNYRQEWRNPSTHDYKIFFSQQEAFLAIVTVSAFVSILLDQIIEQINFKEEQARVQSRAAKIKSSLKEYDSRSLSERVAELLLAFTEHIRSSLPRDRRLNEVELIGSLMGFISSIDPSITSRSEEIAVGSVVYRPDFVFASGKEKAILELKMSSPVGHNIRRAQERLTAFLAASAVNEGVLYFFPANVEDEMIVDKLAIEVGDLQKTIYVVRPDKKTL